MKKLVPDPPRYNSLFSVLPTLPAPDAIAHASELMRGVSEAIDEHCRLHAGEPRLNILVNAAHAADSAVALAEHALARMNAGCVKGGRE
ncbi:hypothetical protein [Pseudomonas xanthosomatis]|uniref:hypothetical protein n=1 Tax=Pseudomonas xanthosomatis TaxID=2842356 RepID=UPI003514FA22